MAATDPHQDAQRLESSDDSLDGAIDDASPCVGRCELKAGVCVGCFRRIHEITNWTLYTPNERAQINRSIRERNRVTASKEPL